MTPFWYKKYTKVKRNSNYTGKGRQRSELKN